MDAIGLPNAPFMMVGALAVVSVITTIFWMIVGWRAMRAHERIADVLEVLWADRDDERRARMQTQNPAPPK